MKTILLVEDEAIASMATSAVLKEFGFAVEKAYSGEEALLKLAEAEDINLILMDINLGKGMDGTETARLILEKRDIPIIFISSHCEEAIVEKVRHISRYGYIYKGSGDFVLKSSIDMAFQLYEALQEQKKQNIKLEEIMDLARIAWWEMELPSGKVTFDKRRATLLGYNPGQFSQSADFVKLVHPDDLDKINHMIEMLLHNEKDSVEIEYRIRNSENQYIWNLDTGRVTSRDPETGIIQLSGFVCDINRIKKLEKELSAREDEIKNYKQSAK